VVNPAFIGGVRMASELIRPHVVSFLDRMLRSQHEAVRVEEVVVAGSSSLVGLSLHEADLQGRTGLIPVALKQPDADGFVYNPASAEKLQADTVLVCIGNPDQISQLRELCST
jgi:voltage-gated potassium channel